MARLVGARGFHKFVAIKTLLPEFRDEKRIEEMLLEEARIASLIHHPNVCQTTELGEHRGYLYMVMEWVDGESLSFIMKRAEERGWIPLPVAVQLVAQACRGLHAAHELTSDLGVHLGVVHRDVSPHNILVTHAGVVKLVDFGIAKAMNEQGSLTANGELKGKYSFMAPEQVLTSEVDRRADVFALGITLYMLLTRRHPFKVNTKASVLAAITSDQPPTRPSKYIPSCPPALEALVMKALEKDPDKRFPSADAMRVALESALPGSFAPRFEAEVTKFLVQTMGDRAEARREALRRFQLSADERALNKVQTGGPALPSQSAGSFRALVVDSDPDHSRVDPTVMRASDRPTSVGRPRRGRGLTLGLVALAVATFAAAFVARRLTLVWPSVGGEHTAAAEPTLPPREAVPVAPTGPAPRGLPAVATLAPEATSAPAPSASIAEARQQPDTASHPASTAPKASSSAPLRRPAKKAAPKADAANDLLAPDYAE